MSAFDNEMFDQFKKKIFDQACGAISGRSLTEPEYKAIATLMSSEEAGAYLRWTEVYDKATYDEQVRLNQKVSRWYLRSTDIYGFDPEMGPHRIAFIAKCIVGGTFIVLTNRKP